MSDITTAVAELADEYGILAGGVRLLPKPVLKSKKIKRRHITPGVEFRANDLNRSRMQQILERLATSKRFSLITFNGSPILDQRSPHSIEDNEGSKERTRKSHRSPKLFVHKATAVIRSMGKEGWSSKQSRAAIKRAVIDLADATVSTQLAAGKTGQRGDPASLTMDQENQLYDSIADLL
mgnify:FL=1